MTPLERYFGEFTNVGDVNHYFSIDEAEFEREGKSSTPGMIDQEILFAVYDRDGYDGMAFVLFERFGQLYEVNGSHCSCDGLEGQWRPEETTWAALALRSWVERSDTHFYESFSGDNEARALVLSRVSTPIWRCSIGTRSHLVVPPGADFPMRQAIQQAFFDLTGTHAEFTFSGWNAQLTADQLAVLDERS